MNVQAEYAREHGRLRLARILKHCLNQRGLDMSCMPRLHAGHWWVHFDGTWIRTTDVLNLELLRYGNSEGQPFTAWTEKRMYFPATYDGTKLVVSISRNPDGQATQHIGGG